MTDFDDQLRAAMASADGPPPAGLTEGVRRRHRRHIRRNAVACLAVVAAIVIGIPPATRALQSGSGQSSGDSASADHSVGAGSPGSARASATAAPVAAAGTVLAGCDTANVGQVASSNLGQGWRSWAGRAGPVWFVNVGGRHNISGHGTVGRGASVGGSPTLYVIAVVITGFKPGSAVVVRVVPADQQYLRFLYGPADSINSGSTYTMADGESGVTFVMCPLAGNPASPEPITDYYGGLVVDGARCVPVDVFLPGRANPIGISLGVCH
jgi:hypothetical protein